MRVVIVGRSKQLISAETGLHAAMRRVGHTVILVDDRKLRQRIGRRAGTHWLLARLRWFRPERVVFFKPHDVDVFGFERARDRTQLTMWYRDLTPPPDPMLERLTERARHVHDVFLAAGEQAGAWAARGAPMPKWLPNAADRDLDQPQPPDPRFACDIAFMGRGISPGEDLSRAKFLVELAQRYHVRVWGQNWGQWAKELNWDGSAVYGADFARVCASAKIVLDIQPALWKQANYDQFYASNRMVKVLACGGCLLTQGGAGLQRVFREAEHCGWYRTAEEGFAQVERYMSDDRLRADVRRNAREYVWQHHMMENRVHNLLTGEPYQNPLDS